MSDTIVSQIHSPIEDALTAALKRGAEELLAKAVEAEVVRLLEGYEQLRALMAYVTQNGFSPARLQLEIQLGKPVACLDRFER